MVGRSSSLREEEEEVPGRPAGCFYPGSARQAGDTEKCLQGSRTVKFLCQVAPRREVPYARGPEPRPGCEGLRGCFCMACRQTIPPSCLERGLAQVLNMALPKSRLFVFQKFSSRFRPRRRPWNALRPRCWRGTCPACWLRHLELIMSACPGMWKPSGIPSLLVQRTSCGTTRQVSNLHVLFLTRHKNASSHSFRAGRLPRHPPALAKRSGSHTNNLSNLYHMNRNALPTPMCKRSFHFLFSTWSFWRVLWCCQRSFSGSWRSDCQRPAQLQRQLVQPLQAVATASAPWVGAWALT